MQHRWLKVISSLTAVLLGCNPDHEPGAEAAAGAGGSQTDDSSTGVAAERANPTATHTRAGSATNTSGQGGTASRRDENSGPFTRLGGASSRVTRAGDSSGLGGTMTWTNGPGGASAGSSAIKATAAANGGSSSNRTSGTKGATGGSANSSIAGSATSAGGSSITMPTGSKRGIAANIAPGAAFHPAVAWWYNWAVRSTASDVGIEFVPMVWGEASVSSAIPSGSRYLLGFNEPNFFAQANLSAAQAASLWPKLQANVGSSEVKLVGPGMNYCGPASQCHGTDPYVYLKDFFSACSDCRVDYVAVHWYNCDLPSLRDYLEPGGNLPGFEQFGKPIWLTEFSCDEKASLAQQEAYMRAAIPYLEANPNVARYSWFSAGPIPNARLIDTDGSPTALGRVYISLPSN